MKLQPRLVTAQDKTIIGKKMSMSVVENKTGQLWQKFMQNRSQIQDVVGSDKYSINIYDETYFKAFDPSKEFIKWAGVVVAQSDNLPDEFETMILSGGLYAVFDYKGSARDSSIFQYIYSEWLPKSDYLLDNRPHFEVLGAKYSNTSPDSEEEIWIPVKNKN